MSRPDEQVEDEIEYGKWMEYTADEAVAQARKEVPQLQNIWPHWNNGVPKKLRRYVTSPSFYKGKVHHKSHSYFITLELQWCGSKLLAELQARPSLLPTGSAQRVGRA
jgi:hypothetical protein